MNTQTLEPEIGGSDFSGTAAFVAEPTTNIDASPAPTESPLKITQSMLKRILRFKKMQREIQPLLRQVKAAAAKGYEIEEGPCTLHLHPCKIQRKVPKAIIEALGLTDDKVAQLEATLGATEGVTATVKEFGEIYPFEA